ncbi:energy transducer TonB [Luteimonas aquatica]|uniref:energy transducer TonB n=1 Tax=Luteimonas aquatica TaxID=450364 RepID=UPI001F55AAAC|nr:energy transducer TonB [Luteimonas aquatica]
MRNRFEKTAWGLALALAAGGAGAVGPVAFDTTVKVAIDASGTPTQVLTAPKLPQPVREKLEESVKAWRFTPPSRDGKAVAGATFVRLAACAMPDARGGLTMSVAYKGNGPEALNMLKALPKFPSDRDALREKRVEFSVEYTVDPNGRAKLAEIKQVEGSDKALKAFTPALREWVSKLRFTPEEVDGMLVSTRMRTPIVYRVSSAALSPTREQEQERLLERGRMSPECLAAGGAAAPPLLQAYAVDSQVKFLGPG